MKVLESRQLRVVLLLMLIACLSFYALRQSYSTKDDALSMYTQPPIYDTHGTVPGNPSNAREDLSRIYQAMNVFREHHGHYPEDPIELINDAGKYPTSYGLKKGSELKSMMINPDSQYADGHAAREQPSTFIAYQMRDKRYDGTALGSAKASGTRDVLAWTSIYYHHNLKDVKNSAGKVINRREDPVGYFVVLWDDGSVEQVPYDKQLYAPIGRDEFQTGFPGQAGLPAKTMTYEQFQKVGT